MQNDNVTSNAMLYLWVGYSKSKETFYKFFEEKYSEDEDAPMNAFIESQGGTWYDHDWVERIYHDETPSAGVLDGFFSYLQQHYVSEGEARVLRLKTDDLLPAPANATVVFFDGASVPNGQDVFEQDMWLKYIGAFPYKSKYKRD